MKKSFRNSLPVFSRKQSAILLLTTVFFIPLLSLPLSADSVVLKNGRRFQNVRTHLGKKNLRVEFPGGKIRVFPKELLKKLTLTPVNWPHTHRVRRTDRKRKENRRSRIPPPSTKKDDSSENRTNPPAGEEIKPSDQPTSDHSKKTAPPEEATQTNPTTPPSDNSKSDSGATGGGLKRETFLSRLKTPSRHQGFHFLMGLIPGWSGHYLQDRMMVGHAFSVLELAILFGSARWGEPVPLFQDPLFLLGGFTLFNAELSAGTISPQFLIWLSYSQNTVRDPANAGGYMSLKEYKQTRRGIAGLLILVMLGDAISSGVLAGREEVHPRESGSGQIRPSVTLDQSGGETRAQLAFQLVF